ncbi:SprT-like domain-containing protein [Buchananella felis]|uniref:SprT-like domain-containing protein n=1 Tax=Buchananella felis TaxID=3231492 RepID=UPI003528BB96
MDLAAVERMARTLMDQHGLTNWTFKFDRARKRAGACSSTRRTISLSRALMELFGDDAVRETILHEIAHALVGDRHGHDSVWRAKAQQIGASGATRLPAHLPSVPGQWVGRCPNGHEVHRHRRPSPRPVSCARCNPRPDKRFQIVWEERPAR